ncbi:HAD family hydrolase [Vibrio sp. LaRot3]|uniref:HAD family hydrolase n=1 Tax=Vibrio sp. LaRot3 TaxID=2998829 RepID=UPI0022CE105C|nr:HAD family hydrolase [Vibrio sp. LaRot3]MDA0149797.1 HAD-IB family hydrolase [Vibrio sp. LaRot3]
MTKKNNLALFDFDGTLTNQDAYTAFLFYATPKVRLALGMLFVWPIVLLYKWGKLPASKTRPVLSRVAFWLRSVEKVNQIAERYNQEFLSQVIRPNALERLQWHQQQGDDIYVVSASLSPYLQIWCKQHGVNLLCSKLEQKDQRYTGRYVHGDCSLENKVKAIHRAVNLDDYKRIYAYGDTYEDRPMLGLADERYYCWRKEE